MGPATMTATAPTMMTTTTTDERTFFLLRHLVQDVDRQIANSMRLARLLEEHDCAGMKNLFQAFFASIPYQR